MRAAVLEAFGAPLRLVADHAEPEAGPGEVIVRTRAAGICRTDLKVIDGAIPTTPLPLVPGHEIAGEVVALGAGVSSAAVGDRVLVSLDVSCGTCGYCRIGELAHCANLQRIGMELDGGLAELVRVPASNLIPVPDAIDLDIAAVIPDAVASPYHAVVHHAQAAPGQTIAVYGLGGLGLSAVQVAGLAGAAVIGIARTPDRRRLAEDLGATATIDPDDGPIPDQLRELTAGAGVHAFIDLVGIEGSAEQALLSCRKGGRVVVVGYLVPRLEVPMMRLVYDEVSIHGSRGSTRKDLFEVVDLVERGRLSPVIGARPGLDEVNAALDQLRDGTVIGRSVVRLP
jgi:alcohol dehydrogenase, propanol-preferring